MARALRIVVLGDSLAEGFGVAPGEDYPALLEALLHREGVSCRVVNAGVSGDTCRGASARLGRVLSVSPDLVVVEIGLNDILMGAMPERIRACVTRILERLASEGVAAVLAGMVLPETGDPDTERDFADLYAAAARDAGAVLLPAFNRPAFECRDGLQFDGLHPTSEGYRAIAANSLPHVVRAIGRLAEGGGRDA